MSSKSFPFVYNQISKCVEETKLNQLSTCKILYQKHQSFYKRSSTHTNTPGRFEEFISNVNFVHNHNQNPTSVHEVTLNQFSDLFQNELPLFPTNTAIIDADDEAEVDIDLDERDNSDEIDSEQINIRPFTIKITNDFDIFQSLRNFLGIHDDPSLVVYSPTKIPENKKSHSKRQEKKWIVMEYSKHHNHLLGQTKSCNGTNCNTSIRAHGTGSFVYDFNSSNDNWRRNLDWASENNPDGVPIVHTPLDQGTCGSCWSFAAIGSLEANVARNAAMDVFYNEMPPSIQTISSSWKHNDTLVAAKVIQSTIPPNQLNQAVHKAQQIESKAINLAKLSIQELIDCDTKHNQGCIGGNPVMAFPYIHKHGLVSSNDYPYDGVQNKKCLDDDLPPIATTNSWGVLKAKDESTMEYALRHLGPISVGFNGGDKAFLLYSGGIFDSKLCSNHPNHAMLITGYGEEEDINGNTVKYWIARNSWGTGWGDKGYIKIKRKEKIKTSGVCGIAKNPSIAVGGYLIDIDRHLNVWQQEHQIELLHNKTQYVRKGIWSSASKSITGENEELNMNQQQISLGIPSVMLFAILGVTLLITVKRHVWSISKRKLKSWSTSDDLLGGEDSLEQTQILNNITFKNAKQEYGSMQ